jgi:hypothetical protein
MRLTRLVNWPWRQDGGGYCPTREWVRPSAVEDPSVGRPTALYSALLLDRSQLARFPSLLPPPAGARSPARAPDWRPGSDRTKRRCGVAEIEDNLQQKARHYWRR